MKSLNLQEAAELLKIHPITLLEKVKVGEVPGCKIGRRWVFIEVDLIEHIRAQYQPRALQSENRKDERCHFSNAKTQNIGGLKSRLEVEKYREALGLKTKL